MLKYVVTTTEKKAHITTNNSVFTLISEDYRNYYNLSIDDQMNYSLVIHAVYACLTCANNNPNKYEAKAEFSKFIKYIESRSQIKIQLKRDAGNTLSFEVVNSKPKRLLKRYVLKNKDKAA